MEMTEKGGVESDEARARAIVNSVSATLQKAGQIGAQPEPSSVLNELSKHHVLESLNLPRVTFRFQHQQFQEFFAARSLKSQLLQLVRGHDAELERKFAKQYVNEPRWGESLVMLAEDIAAESGKAEFVEAGSKLVRMALHVDPVFAAVLSNSCGPAVWTVVRDDLGKRLRKLYAQKDRHFQRCALAAMIATGSDDFGDIVVPLLTDANEQVRLSTYRTGAQVVPLNLGTNWREVVSGWPEEARITFAMELAQDPWLADTVEEFALADPSPEVRWNAAHMMSWHGFEEKVERLLGSIDDGSLLTVLRAARPDEIPQSQWPRVVAAYEQIYEEASDPSERLRLLRVLEGFDAPNIFEKMKAELDALGTEQLKPKPGDNRQPQIRWALDEIQKSDPKWVSQWATQKALDKSNWFGAWRGLITEISSEEQEKLYARFSTQLLDKGEQQRVVSVLASVMSPALAARVFDRACEIRAELTPPPRHDQAKWDRFRQVEDLLEAVAPATLLEGVCKKLDQEPVPVELDILTEILPATDLTKLNTRSAISRDSRVKFRAYLKRGAKLGADPDGLRARMRANLAQLLANVGEREDLEDIRRLIEADTVRYEKAQAARLKGDKSLDSTGYGFLYFEAVAMVDPDEASGVVVNLIRSQQYEIVLAQRLPLLARKKELQRGFLGTSRMDFGEIWRARAGEPDSSFIEERRRLFANALLEQIELVKAEREPAADKRGFDQRLRRLGGALAVLDGKRSAKLILELMELPGSWDNWTRVGAIESLLSWGVRLSLDEVMRILKPAIEQLRESGLHGNQDAWLFARCLSVMAFVEPPAAGIAKIRTLISELRFRSYELGGVVAALGASRCDDAIDALIEFAGPDGTGMNAWGEPWIEAIGSLETARSTEILLSFVDPNAKAFDREIIPDHLDGELLARLLAQRAGKDQAVKSRLVELAKGDLSLTKRMLLSKVFAHFSREEDRVDGLYILRDDGSGIPYDLVRSIENAFLERRPYGSSGNAYTLSPIGGNAIRKRLFEMVIGDPNRKQSAFALLGQIEEWRLEHGHPADEPRHPVIESEVSWPPVPS